MQPEPQPTRMSQDRSSSFSKARSTVSQSSRQQTVKEPALALKTYRVEEVLDACSQPDMKREIREHIMDSDQPIDGQAEDVADCVSSLVSEEDEEGEGVGPEQIRAYLKRYDEKVLKYENNHRYAPEVVKDHSSIKDIFKPRCHFNLRQKEIYKRLVNRYAKEHHE